MLYLNYIPAVVGIVEGVIDEAKDLDVVENEQGVSTF